MAADNPYESPRVAEALHAAHDSSGTVIASRWERLGNALVDMMALIFVNSLGQLAFLFAFHDVDLFRNSYLPSWVGGIMLGLVYFIISETVFSRTLGKWVTGTKVVDESGGRPTLRQITIRSLARYIPFEALTFLANPRGMHDRLSDTRVIRL